MAQIVLKVPLKSYFYTNNEVGRRRFRGNQTSISSRHLPILVIPRAYQPDCIWKIERERERDQYRTIVAYSVEKMYAISAEMQSGTTWRSDWMIYRELFPTYGCRQRKVTSSTAVRFKE